MNINYLSEMNTHGAQDIRKKKTVVSPDVTRDEEDPYLKYPANYSIHDAAAQDDVKAVEVLSRRKDINSFDEEGRTPLHISSSHGHHGTVLALLASGADVNAQDRATGRSALHCACLAGQPIVVDILLKHGAVVYDTDRKGACPIHLAAEGGHSDVMAKLSSAGAPINCRDNNGAALAHYAAKHDKVAVIQTLHSLGVDLQTTDKNQRTPLHYAAESGSCKVINVLATLGVALDPKDNAGETPLFLAARAQKTKAISTLAGLHCDIEATNNNHEHVIHLTSRLGLWLSVRQLIKCNVDPSTVYKKGRQPVHIAAEHGCSDVIKVLKNGKADLNAADKNGDRPIHYAVRADRETSVQTLADLGADLNAKGKRGNTALHLAVKESKSRLVKLLTLFGADSNAENECGLFPVYYACLNEDRDSAKCLLRSSAQINKVNDDEGMPMLHVMAEEGVLPAMTVMKELNANMNVYNTDGQTCVHIAADAGQEDVLKTLQANGADMDAPNKMGLSALHVAVMKDATDQVDLLCSVGASLNVKSKNFNREADDQPLCTSTWPPIDVVSTDYWKIKVGMTPLHLALLHGHVQMFDHLIECGADIDVTNDSRESLFQLAVLFSMADWYQRLIALGIDRNCQDVLGRTPLHYAVHTGQLENVRALLKYGAKIQAADTDGRTPLHYVGQEGHFLMLPLFTSYSEDSVNCRDKGGQTPLYDAAQNGHVDTIMELVQLGADIHTQDNYGNTAMHLAAAWGRHEAIVQLTSLGANLNIQNEDMKTPLHLAGDHGRGEAMEYLLMAGGNPALRDKNNLLPSTYKLSGPIKAAVNRLIKHSTTSSSSKYKPGEICCQGKKVPAGKHVVFEKLSLAVTLESEEKVAPIIFFHRTPSDEKDLEIRLGGLEEIISDVYEMRVLRLDTACSLVLEVPMDGYPGVFQSYMKTTDEVEFNAHTTTEENGVPMFVTNIPIIKGTACRFAIVVRPRLQSYTVPPAGDTLLSATDRRIRLEVPPGAFYDETRVNVQVLQTDNIERTGEPLLVTDVVKLSVEAGTQLRKKAQLTLPLHAAGLEPDEVIVFAIGGEPDIEDETKWKLVQSLWRIQNGCVTFNVSSLCIYVAIAASLNDRYAAANRRLLAKERIKRALQRETSVVFFYAATPKKGSHLAIFECTTPGRFPRRQEFWEGEGFHLHPQIQHSGHFVAKPNQAFTFHVTGNLRYLDTPDRKLKLTFNPRAYKYQTFYLTKINKAKPAMGEISVFTELGDDKQDTNESESVNCLTSIPVELPIPSKCPIS